ncbi:MAG: FAD-dependent oxidoreductase [Aliidongia sp.]
MQRALSPDQGRLARRRAAGTRPADCRLDPGNAAGGFHTLNGDPNVAKLQGYTIRLYDELERISGQSCSLHRSGGLMLADTKERMEWLKMAHGRARYLGLETELLTPAEAKAMHPLLEEQYFYGAMLDAADGNLDPAGTTHAYAKAARLGRRRDPAQDDRDRSAARADGSWGRHHQHWPHPRRACRQCRRPLGA